MNPLILVLSFALFAPHVASASSTYGPDALWAAEEVSTPRRIAKGKKKGKRNSAKREQRRAKVEKKIRTFLVVELTDALELSDELAVKLANTIKETQGEQHRLREKAHEHMKTLKDMLADESSSDGALKKQATKTQKAMKKAQKMDEALFDAISGMLTPRQQAKLVLVGPQIRGKIHRMLQRARKGGHPGKGMRGPHGHGGPGGPPGAFQGEHP